MKNRLSTQPKLTPEQARILAEVALVSSEMKQKLEEISVAKIATKAGVKRQALLYHMKKIKAQREGGAR